MVVSLDKSTNSQLWCHQEDQIRQNTFFNKTVKGNELWGTYAYKMLPSTGIKSKTFQTKTASLTISTISGFVHKVSFYLS